MIKTLLISFQIKKIYLVNSILYRIRQLKLFNRFLPNKLSKNKIFKVISSIIFGIYELFMLVFGKYLFFSFMIIYPLTFYPLVDKGLLYLHLIIILSLIGAVNNNDLLNPSKDKYYSVVLLNIDARKYAVVNYGYRLLGFIIVYLILGVFFVSPFMDLPLYVHILVPFAVVGIKLVYSYVYLSLYKKHGFKPTNYKLVITFVLVMLALAYGMPLINLMFIDVVAIGILVLMVIGGLFSLSYICRFNKYRVLYQQSLNEYFNAIDVTKIKNKTNKNLIYSGALVTSNKEGFELLNDLFVKRHKKILWSSSLIVSVVSGVVVIGLIFATQVSWEISMGINMFMSRIIPFLVAMMYFINRGSIITQALFGNCDYGLFSYQFFKDRNNILKLFLIRLRTLIMINLLPSMIMAFGFTFVLYLSGGTSNNWNYLILIAAILSLSVFFSVHYLTMYYLFQPFNKETEVKSIPYNIVMGFTYFLCVLLVQLKFTIFLFGIGIIVFATLYCLISVLLVYKLADKTFKLK
ncbi:MAG: hypothetical protein WBO70_07850 [Erysipelotrichaceae bacterium]